jgi:predicted dehydrogenase
MGTMKFKTALIGCGRISPFHIDAFVNNKDCMILEAVCDPVTERAEEQAEGYRRQIPETLQRTAPRCYADYKKMLAEIKPDIVTVATESGKHPEIAINCLNAGANVICEKPMALSTKDADAMISAAKKAGRKLAVCLQNRFNPPVRRLRDAVEAGRFGRLLHSMIQIRWYRSPAYYADAAWRGTWGQDGGTLMNQCIHGIDLLQWVMGEDPVRVHAQTRRYIRPIEAEDFGAAIVEFKNGAVGIIEGTVCVFSGDLNETLSVFGEKGSAVIGGISVNKMETWRLEDADSVGDTEEKVRGPDEEAPPTVYGLGHSALFRDFALSVEENREPLIDGEAGKKSLELILAIYKSQKTGKAVDLPCDFSTLEMEGYFGK